MEKKYIYFASGILILSSIILIVSLQAKRTVDKDRLINQSTILPTESITSNEKILSSEEDKEIVVIYPVVNSYIKSPLIIEGSAKGGWYFEGSFPVKLVDSEGKIIGSAVAHALGDWVSSALVPFKASIDFTMPTTATGILVLENDNPSGLSENIKKISVPVNFVVPK